METDRIISIARNTILQEAASVSALVEGIDASFEAAVKKIWRSSGRLVVSGIGKSAIVAQKMVATFNSTGTPSIYLHAADAIHGDLGMVQTTDIVLVISKSGNSPEIKVLVQLIRNFGNLLIGMVGNTESFLAIQADLVLNATVAEEACPNNLAPTSSTTAQMVLGDALAVCLMQLKQFSPEDFARFHPGGMLGKKLFLRVIDLLANHPVPKVFPETNLPETVVEMTSKLLGATAVVNHDGTLFGIITDGDLRRMLVRKQPINGLSAKDICSVSPKQIAPDALAVDALELMRQFGINHLVVLENAQYVGIIHLQDLIKEGLV